MLAAVLMVLYIAALVAALVLIVLILRARRLSPATVGLSVYIVTSALWTVIAIYLLLNRSTDGVMPTVWITVVVSFLVVAVRILGHALSDAAWRPSRRYLVGLVPHPAAMVTIASVPALHGLIVSVDAQGQSHYAAGYWAHAIVCYVLALHAGFLLVRARRQVQALVGYSNAVVLLPWTLPVLVNGFSVWQDGPLGIDYTPVTFVVSFAVVGRAMTTDGLASIMPIARLRVFDNLKDALVVLDPAGRIVDANRRALLLLEFAGGASELSGRHLQAVCAPIATIARVDGEHDVSIGGVERVIDVVCSPLVDNRARELGLLVQLRDITESVLQRRELARVSEALADEARLNEALRAELAEQVVRDAGTGLHNRRFVFDTLPVIADECAREGAPLSVVLLDIDRFKAVNDTYGHAVGDRALKAIAMALDKQANGEVVARFGGEEFVALLPGATTAQAVATAEAMRAACAAVVIAVREGTIGVTLSAGVATAQPGVFDSAALLDVADRALYDAKNGGRNRVCAANP